MGEALDDGIRYNAVVDADIVLNGGVGAGATNTQILLAILLELRMLRAAAVEPDNSSGV